MAERGAATARTAVPPGLTISPGFLLMALGRRVREQVEAELRTEGTSLRHLAALGHLSHEPGLSYSELGRRAGVTPQSMQATLLQLEATGAVERRTPTGRGRTAQLHVTTAGTAVLRRSQRTIERVERSHLAGLTPQRREALTDILLELFPTAPAAASAVTPRPGRPGLR